MGSSVGRLTSEFSTNCVVAPVSVLACEAAGLRCPILLSVLSHTSNCSIVNETAHRKLLRLLSPVSVACSSFASHFFLDVHCDWLRHKVLVPLLALPTPEVHLETLRCVCLGMSYCVGAPCIIAPAVFAYSSSIVIADCCGTCIACTAVRGAELFMFMYVVLGMMSYVETAVDVSATTVVDKVA